MKKQDEEDLKMEIQHIFDSGANEIRVLEMVKMFIKRRYVALTPTAVVQVKPEYFYCEDEQAQIAEETGDKINRCGKQCYYCSQ